MRRENIKRILYALYEDGKGLITLSEETEILDEAIKKLNKLGD